MLIEVVISEYTIIGYMPKVTIESKRVTKKLLFVLSGTGRVGPEGEYWPG